MKRFLLFAGQIYYPCGGWQDFHSSHDHAVDAKARGEALLAVDSYSYDWWQVIDLATGDEIAAGLRP